MPYFFQLLLSYLQLYAWIGCFSRADHPRDPAQYQKLPSLREQAKIEQAWREERIARIPGLLQKYGADAWLVRPVFY
jgi:hypothetical protein